MTAIAMPNSEDIEPLPPARASDEGGHEMTLLEHLQELRRRLFVSALAVALGTVVGLIFAKTVMDFLQGPARQVHPGFRAVQIEPLEFLGAYFKVSILVGLIISMPVLIYEILAFVVPGLTRSERKWLLPILAGTFALFLGGVVFSYYVIVPRALDFFLNFGSGVTIPTVRIGSYIDLLVHLLFWTGVIFELPIVMMVPAKFGAVTAGRYLKWWRYAIVLGFVAAAAVIPNINPLMQISVAVPIIGLYFLGVGLAKLVQPRV